MNKAIIIGNVGNLPEVKTLEGGSTVASFSIATSKSYKNKAGEEIKETEWHNIVAWNQLAEIIERYVQKGSKLMIEGEIKTRTWEDKEGNKRYSTEIVARQMEMLDSLSGNQDGGRTEETKSAEPAANEANEEEDDLPF